MQTTSRRRNPSLYSYRKVRDSRKRRVRGIWMRAGRYYANLTVSDDLDRKTPRWVPLNGTTLDEVKADYRRLLVEREDDRLRPLGLTPTVAEYVVDAEKTEKKEQQNPDPDGTAQPATAPTAPVPASTKPAKKKMNYALQLAVSGKRPSTIQKEQGYLNYWAEKLGHLRLNKIRPHHLNSVLTELATKNYSARSINLYLIAIRGMLKAAQRDGYIKPPLPCEGLAWQPVSQKKRDLYTPGEIDQVCEVGLKASKNGQVFADYIRFLQYSGARRNEGLRVRWQDIDFERCQVTIGAEGDSKNREPRVVDFNPALEGHLEQMKKRRQPDSGWLFPSPQRGDQDVASKTFMESLRLVRNFSRFVCQSCQKTFEASAPVECLHCNSKKIQKQEPILSEKLQRFGFHDLRHHFISYGVMSGVDFMTLAKWVGHKDGGVLIGKVYGHLADQHRKTQASRLSFGPTILPLPSQPETQAPAECSPSLAPLTS